MISYSRTSEDSLSHSYNGLDDRTATARTPSGGGNADIRRFATAPDGRAMGEYGSSASDVRAEFIWMSPEVGDNGMFGGDDGLGGYMPIALATAASGGGTTLNWVHGDHLGTPIVITDATGTAIPQPGGYTTPAFPGQSRTLYDLYYNRYRDYDPSTGRYIQADPIGLAGGQSPYSYAMGNPLRYMDPTGEFVPTVIPISPLPSPTARWLVRWWNKDDCPDVMPPPPPPPPKQDWCGSSGSEGVPDGNWGEACRKHDACYGTPGANKERCDIRLTIGITNECIIRVMSSNMCAVIGFGYGAGLLVDRIWNPWSPSLEAFRNGQRR